MRPAPVVHGGQHAHHGALMQALRSCVFRFCFISPEIIEACYTHQIQYF
jgi:hypothetical protein